MSDGSRPRKPKRSSEHMASILVVNSMGIRRDPYRDGRRRIEMEGFNTAPCLECEACAPRVDRNGFSICGFEEKVFKGPVTLQPHTYKGERLIKGYLPARSHGNAAPANVYEQLFGCDNCGAERRFGLTEVAFTGIAYKEMN